MQIYIESNYVDSSFITSTVEGLVHIYCMYNSTSRAYIYIYICFFHSVQMLSRNCFIVRLIPLLLHHGWSPGRVTQKAIEIKYDRPSQLFQTQMALSVHNSSNQQSLFGQYLSIFQFYSCQFE